MDIKKLALEMDLTCINAYKLDALKSVSWSNEIANADVRNQNNEELAIAIKDPGSVRVINGDKISCTTDKCKCDVTETGMGVILLKCLLALYVIQIGWML